MSQSVADWPDETAWFLGKFVVLLIPGMRLSEMPPVGTPLKQQDMRVLLVEPVTKWTREEVGQS